MKLVEQNERLRNKLKLKRTVAGATEDARIDMDIEDTEAENKQMINSTIADLKNITAYLENLKKQ